MYHCVQCIFFLNLVAVLHVVVLSHELYQAILSSLGQPCGPVHVPKPKFSSDTFFENFKIHKKVTEAHS